MAPTGWLLAAPVVLAVSGMMVALSARASDGEDLRGGRYTELTDLVRAEEQRAAELTDRLESLQREVETLAAAEAQADAGSPNAVDWAEQLRPIAGLSAVTGPGTTVALDDAPLPAHPLPVRPAVARRSPVVGRDDREAAGRPELHVQLQAAHDLTGWSAMHVDQHGRRVVRRSRIGMGRRPVDRVDDPPVIGRDRQVPGRRQVHVLDVHRPR